ncbi:CPBP family intramembrane glutamic endopeptidase [Natronobacterium gregoryi]|uniref:Abortive infection protein n=2 Tax=Natronobacterium gregoryi TaxID=44930 RepID=L0AF03_NATGS|nr:type II CAAX endopeptidase family protein [Natronobacterium gregoryi]AFZ72009.1 putative metal-dependent membrane protease [Natronobacterium gregoryi SP2]ELY62715.1 Abortive infection protein [Natronobacterium gregoryi SP2]PLK20861.1 CPBP family intramembrane metalloprotease [Natronobacterium gregoryi SP2]SFJ19919.1 Membrane protease YdiL, CAAX protease family [Natronobacterium gregoryi]
MENWTAFAGITGVVLVFLLVLSHLTQTSFSDGSDTAQSTPRRNGKAALEQSSGGRESGLFGEPGDSGQNADGDAVDVAAVLEEGDESDRRDADPVDRPVRGRSKRSTQGELDPESLSTGVILANVALSQGVFALVLVGAAIYTGIPAEALGIEFSVGYLETGVVVGVAAGLGLYVVNEVGAATATWLGFDHDEQLRELLAPETTRGWVVLLVGVLPIIAVFEELLFRAALIGAFSMGFGIDPWLLAVLSSVAFGIGHGMQGSVGIVVTGLLGFVLAAVFILTGSLLVVVVAHYLINALEFLVHEGLGLEWAETIES